MVNRTPVIRGFDATYERMVSIDIGYRGACAPPPIHILPRHFVTK
jgi:hypothetical protein